MLGIIFAMEEEAQYFAERIEIKETHTKAKINFVHAVYNDKLFIYCVSGMGKVNAAMATQILISDFGVDVVLNVGLAGSLNPYVKLGDIVLSTNLYQHDFDLTPMGHKMSEIPDTDEVVATFALRENLETILRKMNVPVHVGTIVTGDQFIASQEKKVQLAKDYDALCTEMEGGAVGQVATQNDVNFLVMRAISDNGDEDAPETFKEVSERATKIFTEALLEYIK